jgi:DNA-binding MurR/RpiR family transcriptional regulator
VTDIPGGHASVRKLLMATLDELSNSERKVGRALLAQYPTAGLTTVVDLATAASVSPPTVVRFVSRLGFSGYPEFQKRLVREVQERLGSPLEQYGRADLKSGEGGLSRASQVFSASITASIEDLPQSEFDRAVAMLADPRRRVRLIGGRFSQLLAEYLGAHLILLRADVQVIEADEFSRIAAVSDTRRGDLLVVFDYRRYDPQIVRFSRRVAERGGELVLFTDHWLSPAAEVAGTVLPANVEAPSPFDSLVPAMAIVETVIAGITELLGETGRQRLETIEALRTAPPAPAG